MMHNRKIFEILSLPYKVLWSSRVYKDSEKNLFNLWDDIYYMCKEKGCESTELLLINFGLYMYLYSKELD